MPSIRSHLFRFLMKSMANWNLPLDALRAKIEKSASSAKVPKGVGVRPVAVETGGRVRAEWLEPANAPRDKAILYLHGGGYVMCSCSTHRAFVGRLAEACDVRALVLDYRLAPEHPYPAALEDSLGAYHWLRGQGVSPNNIIIAGDSAGGGLVLSTLISLRDSGAPLPSMAICLSPWTDLACTGESLRANAKVDPWGTMDSLAMGAHYVGTNEARHPLISPLYADLHGLPATLIHAGSDDILLSDATRFADRAKAAGVDVTLKIWNRMWHGFQLFAPLMPEANRAIEDIARYVRLQSASPPQ
jgi:acetyl esterase/lipase